MAITAANLTNSSTSTDATSFNTASVTPGSNRLIIVTISYSVDAIATVTGNGLTWVEFGGGGAYSTALQRSVRCFRAMGASPSAGAITLSFDNTITSIDWSVDEFNGVDTTGTNGSGAIVQSLANLPGGSSTSLTVTLAAFASADNMAFGGFSYAAAEAATPGAGFTTLANVGAVSPDVSLLTEYKLNDPTVDHSSTSNVDRGGIAAEIKASGAAPPAATPNGLLLLGVGE